MKQEKWLKFVKEFNELPFDMRELQWLQFQTTVRINDKIKELIK
jgi:hypothetical protein